MVAIEPEEIKTMKCMVMAVMLLLGATLTAQARSANSFIPAGKSPTEFYTATAICDKKIVRPLGPVFS